MPEYKVYRHTFPNGKVYIGITCQRDPNRRWQNGSGYRTQNLMYRAIRKYGWDNIQHTVVLSGLSKTDAELCEMYMISRLHSDDPQHGYNVDHGGNCTGTHSEETKRKIGDAQRGSKNHNYGKSSPLKGRRQTPEQVEKNRISHLGQASYWKGRHLPESMLEALKRPKSELHKKHLSEARSVPVICIETGEWFPSGKAAAEAKGISRGSIAYVVKGKRKTAGGFHWRLANS